MLASTEDTWGAIFGEAGNRTDDEDAVGTWEQQARGFKQKDYARRHPSGAIGRAMLLKTGDIMRTKDRNAIGGENMSVREALFAMTSAKSLFSAPERCLQ